MPGATTIRGYGTTHQRERERLRPLVESGEALCVRCGKLIAATEPWDLGHYDGHPDIWAGPEHARCNRGTSGRRTARPNEPPPDRDGLSAGDRRWLVPWLDGLRQVPENATWPRLMTVPHPDAVGSLGDAFAAWAAERTGRPLRWWQQLVAARLLEHDRDLRLVWSAMILSLARQLGKSWLLRELCLWRINQGYLFGEPQDVIHTGADLAIVREIQRPARLWARTQHGNYRVREANGQEWVEVLEDGSRWMLKSRTSPEGFTASLVAVDEAWKVKATVVEDGFVPTMVEREQPQLLLISTAHRLATGLMLRRRQAALDELEDGTGDLLIEWSAPPGAAIDDVDAWKAASPHWDPRRERLLTRKIRAMASGEVLDPDDADPESGFRTQWLDQWPRTLLRPGMIQPLLPDGLWASRAVRGVDSGGEVWVAIEDAYGRGAAVGACGRLPDGVLELDGWVRDEWDDAIEDVVRLAGLRKVRRFVVGASLLDRVPQGMGAEPFGLTEARMALPLLRQLATVGQVVHDIETAELDVAFAQAQVRESGAGLYLVPGDGAPLAKAAVWALMAAHKPAATPGIH